MPYEFRKLYTQLPENHEDPVAFALVGSCLQRSFLHCAHAAFDAADTVTVVEPSDLRLLVAELERQLAETQANLDAATALRDECFPEDDA